MIGTLSGAFTFAALLLFVAAFLLLIAPEIAAIVEDRHRLERDFRFTAFRLRHAQHSPGDF